MIPVFYANKDTKTPVKVSAVIVVVNIVLNVILMQFLQHAGLALATSLSAMIQFVILIILLQKKAPQIAFPNIWSEIIKMTGLSILLFFALNYINQFYTDLDFWSNIIKSILLSFTGIILFVSGTVVLRVEYTREIRKKIWQKIIRR